MMSGIINSQNNLGGLVADWAGLKGTDAVKVEAACASGSVAFRSALMALPERWISSACWASKKWLYSTPHAGHGPPWPRPRMQIMRWNRVFRLLA